jgi:hypothetical protein
MILNLAQLRTFSGILQRRPTLYIEFESFLGDILTAVAFLDGTKEREVDVSHLYSDIESHLIETRDYIHRKPRIFKVTSPLTFLERPFDLKRFNNGFTKLLPTRESTDPICGNISRILSVLRRTFDAPRSTEHCSGLIQLIVDAHIRPEILPILEERISALPIAGIETAPVTPFERQRLIILLCTLNTLTKMVELELTLSYGIRRSQPFRKVEPALAELNAELSKVIDGNISSLPTTLVRTYGELAPQVKPFYTDIGSITRRLLRLNDEEGLVKFGATEDQRDALKYIPKSKPAQGSLTAFSETYLKEFEVRNTDGVVNAFVKFFRFTSTSVSLRSYAGELRDLLAELFEKEENVTLEKVLLLNREIAKRTHLIDSDNLGIVMSVLSLDILEFPVVEDKVMKLVVDNVCELAVLVLNDKEDEDIERMREMAILLETLADLVKEKVSNKEDPQMKKKLLEIIEKAFKFVPPQIAGAFQTKMTLLLWLCRTQ